MKVTVKIEGLRELDAALGDLIASTSSATGKAVLRKVLKTAAAPIEADWRSRAPKLSGALAKSGGTGGRLTRRQAMEAKKAPKSTVEQYVGPGGLPQAVQQEFGNAEQPPQPFMRPAWEAGKDQALSTIARELGTEIGKAAARAAKRKARLAAKG